MRFQITLRKYELLFGGSLWGGKCGVTGLMIDTIPFESLRKSELYEKLFRKGTLHTPPLIEVGNQLNAMGTIILST